MQAAQEIVEKVVVEFRIGWFGSIGIHWRLSRHPGLDCRRSNGVQNALVLAILSNFERRQPAGLHGSRVPLRHACRPHGGSEKHDSQAEYRQKDSEYTY
jgi:hypothetical protein